MRPRIAILVALTLAATAVPSIGLLSSASAASTPLSAQVALDWNSIAVDAVRAATTTDGVPNGGTPRSLYQTEGLLYMSYVQAATYDAVTKITRRYEPYHDFDARTKGASPEAAVIAASYNTLVFYLGDPSGQLAVKYAAAIGTLPAGDATTRGIAVGEAAAADLEAFRANDGRNAPVSTPYGVGPLPAGVWVFAPPPSLQSAQTPWLASMTPFTFKDPSRFRAPPPPPLTSNRYTTDFNETKDYGSATSMVRTADQTAIAYFWNANAVNQLNATLRGVAAQHSMDLVDTARLLAMGTMVPTDAGIACFDSKYTWLLWRPVTAIRNADLDGNPATMADPTWTPLVTTPNHPEYPSQHGCVTSALGHVLAHVLGTDAIDVTIQGAQGGASTLTTSKTFRTVQDLDAEIVNARVWIGFHFRNSVTAGENLGQAVAARALHRYFLPSDNNEGNGHGQHQGHND